MSAPFTKSRKAKNQEAYRRRVKKALVAQATTPRELVEQFITRGLLDEAEGENRVAIGDVLVSLAADHLAAQKNRYR